MIKYAIVVIEHKQDINDAWLDIWDWGMDHTDIKIAEKSRLKCIEANPNINPQNIQVLQYDTEV